MDERDRGLRVRLHHRPIGSSQLDIGNDDHAALGEREDVFDDEQESHVTSRNDAVAPVHRFEISPTRGAPARRTTPLRAVSSTEHRGSVRARRSPAQTAPSGVGPQGEAAAGVRVLQSAAKRRDLQNAVTARTDRS